MQVFSAEGCEAEDSVKVTPKQSPQVSMWGLEPAYCESDESRIMYGQPGGGVFEGDGVDGNIFDPGLAGGGSHVITYSFEDVNDCIGRDTTIVHVYPIPDVELGSDTTLCNTDYLVLDAGAGYDTYLWSNGSTSQVASFYGADLGIGFKTVSVIVTLDGCINRGERMLDVIVCNPGISEYGNVPGIEVFPNPASEMLQIRIRDYSGKFNIRITDAEGRVKYKEENVALGPQGNKELILKSFVAGAYFMNIYNEEFLYRITLLIQ
ncbi:MAG: T9SS type A sorting domain-containing protein [Bacteroidota bacterium]|nr:T9SS type A sorting domain-containing protein [Bacteroidota bacterium]